MEEKEKGTDTSAQEKSLDTVVQETIDSDTEFQESLSDLSDDDKAEAINTKTSEVREAAYSSLVEKSNKSEEIANNQKIRAEKAEKKPKETSVSKEPKEDGISQTDLYALMKADVAEEDLSEVTDYAKLKGITVKEALKSTVVQTILGEKAEQRNVAEATNTGNTKTSTGQVSDDVLIANAEKGVMPETDEDLERLHAARAARS